MSILSLVLVFCTILNLALGIFVYINKKENERVSKIYSALAFFVAIWGITNLGTTQENTLFAAKFWSIVGYISALFIAYSFYLFSVDFPKKITLGVKNYPTLLNFFFLLSIGAVLAPGFTIREIIISPWQIVTGPGIFILAVFFVSAMLFSHWILLRKRKSKDLTITERRQIDFVLAGTAISTFFGVIFNLIVPLYGNYSLILLGPSFTIFLIAFIGLAIIRHKLFEIKVIATELLTFALWIFILIRTLLSTSTADQIANGILLILTIIIGIFLIRSVIREVEIREKVEKLALELEKANEQLQELDRQKSEFVSIASHQLRSPLTAIKGYSSMLLEGSFGKLTKKVQEAVHTVFDSSESLVVVIDNFLNLSRIEQGRMTYTMEETELKQYVQGIVNQLLPNAEKKGLKVTYEAPEKIDFTAKIDPDKMRQVILNLIDNSIKYTPTGWIKVALNRTVGGLITLTISDSGIGMSQKTIDKLFKKFSRADNASKTNASGSGLGMYLASEIMKAHGGRVYAESDGEGKGSRFIVEFAHE